MVQIIPAILATTEEEYKEKIEELWESNLFDRDVVQIDLMDGEFVNNTSISAEIVKKYPASFKYELHLMVKDPQFWASQFKDFNKVYRFIIPIELNKDVIDEFISFVRAFTDAEIGFAFEPDTSLSDLGEYLNVAESILIMGVHSGHSGQEFIPEVLDKIKEAADLIKAEGLDCLIGVDGGVNEDNAKMIVSAGADYLVVGSHILKGDIGENVQKIQESIQS